MAAILLAEDDNAVREFVTRALQHDGHDVTAVEDGTLALEALGKSGFDMLLSDIVMPELDGIALEDNLTREEDLVAALDVTLPFYRDANFSGYWKTGAKATSPSPTRRAGSRGGCHSTSTATTSWR